MLEGAQRRNYKFSITGRLSFHVPLSSRQVHWISPTGANCLNLIGNSKLIVDVDAPKIQKI